MRAASGATWRCVETGRRRSATIDAARQWKRISLMSEPRTTRLVAVIFVAGLLALGGCRGEGEYFEISGKLFVFNYRVATATYLVNLKPLQPVGEGETAVATFEDPAGGDPIVVRKKIWPKTDKT